MRNQFDWPYAGASTFAPLLLIVVGLPAAIGGMVAIEVFAGGL